MLGGVFSRNRRASRDVCIALICDDNFVIPTAVTIQSLMSSKSPESRYKVYVIAGDLAAHNVAYLESLGVKGCAVRCVLASTAKYEEFRQFESQSLSCVTVAALLKFDLPNLLAADKVLYLDGDILVREDLSALYATDVSDQYLAACMDSSNMYTTRDEVFCAEEYFNSGVMLLNLHKLRAEDVPALLRHQRKTFASHTLMDQDVFNLVAQGHVRLLPLRYNTAIVNLLRAQGRYSMDQLNEAFGTSYATLDEVAQDAAIIHFASRDKPWKVPVGTMQEEWLGQLRQLVLSHPSDAVLEFFQRVCEVRYDLTHIGWAAPYITARMDVRAAGASEGDLRIEDMSDEGASVTTPAWIAKSGCGYVIQSKRGTLDLTLACKGITSLSVALRGVDERDESGQCVERWVTFTSLTIDGRQMLDAPIAVWHDAPHAVRCALGTCDHVRIVASWVPGCHAA